MGIAHGYDQIVTDGLIYYVDPMNERSYPSSGIYIYDLSKNKYVTQFMDGPTVSSSYGAEFINFDGLNDRLHIIGSHNNFAWTQDGSRGMSEQTIDIWVQTTDGTGNIYSKPWNGNGGYNVRILPSYVTIGCGYPRRDFSLYYSSINLTSVGGWANITCVIDSSSLTAYINGNFNRTGLHTLSGGADTGYASSTGYVSTIMNIYPYNSNWAGVAVHTIQGQLGSVKIYNKALTAQEIQKNYNAHKYRYT